MRMARSTAPPARRRWTTSTRTTTPPHCSTRRVDVAHFGRRSSGGTTMPLPPLPLDLVDSGDVEPYTPPGTPPPLTPSDDDHGSFAGGCGMAPSRPSVNAQTALFGVNLDMDNLRADGTLNCRGKLPLAVVRALTPKMSVVGRMEMDKCDSYLEALSTSSSRDRALCYVSASGADSAREAGAHCADSARALARRCGEACEIKSQFARVLSHPLEWYRSVADVSHSFPTLVPQPSRRRAADGCPGALQTARCCLASHRACSQQRRRCAHASGALRRRRSCARHSRRCDCDATADGADDRDHSMSAVVVPPSRRRYRLLCRRSPPRSRRAAAPRCSPQCAAVLNRNCRQQQPPALHATTPQQLQPQQQCFHINCINSSCSSSNRCASSTFCMHAAATAAATSSLLPPQQHQQPPCSNNDQDLPPLLPRTQRTAAATAGRSAHRAIAASIRRSTWMVNILAKNTFSFS
jgi:hypothetical protein